MRQHPVPRKSRDLEAERVAAEVRPERRQFGRRRAVRLRRDRRRQLPPGRRAEQPRAVRQLRPRSSSTFIHFAMSSAQALMPPAGFVLSLSNGWIGRTLPSTGAWGAATFPPAVAAECLTLLLVMPDLREDARRDEVLPRLAAERLDDLAGHEVQHVVVGVGAAEAGRRLDVAQPPGNLLPVVGARGPPEQVARAEAEAAPVNQQVADRQLARHVRVVHLEPRQVVDDGRVPLQLALLDEQAERRGGEHLRVRRDAEQRPRVDRRRVAQLAHAVALGDDHLVVFHDGQADAGDVERLHHALDEAVEVGRDDLGRLCELPGRPQQQGDDRKDVGGRVCGISGGS